MTIVIGDAGTQTELRNTSSVASNVTLLLSYFFIKKKKQIYINDISREARAGIRARRRFIPAARRGTRVRLEPTYLHTGLW